MKSWKYAVPIRVSLNPDESVASNEFIAAQCEMSGERWRRPDVSMPNHMISEKVRQMEEAIMFAGAVFSVTKADISRFRSLVSVTNPYLEMMFRDCLSDDNDTIGGEQ